MQFLEKAGGYVYNQWNSLNPATLLGAIDIIVIEQPDGTLHCSPWHVRFGLLQIMKPSHKKVDVYVNGKKTDLPMKLGDGGEAFFVFEADGSSGDQLSHLVLTSPLLAPASGASLPSQALTILDEGDDTPEPLKLNLNDEDGGDDDNDIDDKINLTDQEPVAAHLPQLPRLPLFEHVKVVTDKLKIPSKVDINGDIVLDMDGYKPSSQKNIENSDELFHKVFIDEINKLDTSEKVDYGVNVWDLIIQKDEDGNIRILNQEDPQYDETLHPSSPPPPERTTTHLGDPEHTYFKTLRLTLEQLQHLGLNYGENQVRFKVSRGLTAEVEAMIYFWKLNMPIVISDIDGTITKLDALGHIMNLVGRDWTHPGVARLFQDIYANGYNIIYLTARSVGQADQTRQYLRGINQEHNSRLPPGPVILSPDRTFAALKREVILKQPEVFKMACLLDIKLLYYSKEQVEPQLSTDQRTPFYAGFGNRITDAISYRLVQIPSHRIFTINPHGEVHMELLELAGVHSSYIRITELVDLFFPPLKEMNTWNNQSQYKQYLEHKRGQAEEPQLPPGERFMPIDVDERFTDTNYWFPKAAENYDDLTDEEDDLPLPPKSPRLWGRATAASQESVNQITINKTDDVEVSPAKLSRPTSIGFAPLKNFMSFGSKDQVNPELDDEYNESEFRDAKQKFQMPGQFDEGNEDDDFTGELGSLSGDDDEDDDDDYDDDEDDEVSKPPKH